MTPRRLSYATLMVALSLMVTSCSSPSKQATPPRATTTAVAQPTAFVSTTIPETPVGTQLAWFLGAVPAAPLSQAVIDAHFDSVFLDQFSPAEFNAVLEEEFASRARGSLVGLLSDEP